MAVGAKAQQLQVDAAQGGDEGLVAGALPLLVGLHAVGHVGVGLVDVHMVEQVVVHEIAVALVVGHGQTDVLVQIHSADLGEVQFPGLILLHQLGVSSLRAAAGGKTQHAVGLQQDLSGDQVGCLLADIGIIFCRNDTHDADPFRLLFTKPLYH